MKFVSLSQLWGYSLFGSNSGIFTVPGFIVSLVGIKKEDRRKRGIKGEKVGVEQERMKETRRC